MDSYVPSYSTYLGNSYEKQNLLWDIHFACLTAFCLNVDGVLMCGTDTAFI